MDLKKPDKYSFREDSGSAKRGDAWSEGGGFLCRLPEDFARRISFIAESNVASGGILGFKRASQNPFQLCLRNPILLSRRISPLHRTCRSRQLVLCAGELRMVNGGARVFLNDQGLHSSANVVANSPDAFNGLALRIFQRPVIPAYPWDIRTFVAAAHCD